MAADTRSETKPSDSRLDGSIAWAGVVNATFGRTIPISPPITVRVKKPAIMCTTVVVGSRTAGVLRT